VQARLSQYEKASESYAQAIAAFDEALRRVPDDVHAHNNKGNVLTLFGELQAKLAQHDDAVKGYKLAMELYSSSLDIAPTQENIRKLRDSIQQILKKKTFCKVEEDPIMMARKGIARSCRRGLQLQY
jgi:tetratricopeptide (TPR) repeat protein